MFPPAFSRTALINERRHLPRSKGVPQSRLAGVLRALRPREVRLLLMPRVVEYPSSERKVSSGRAPRANSPCRIALYPGRVRRSGPHGALGGILACVLDRLIRAVSTRRTTRSCTDRQFWAEPFGFVAPPGGEAGMAARARRRKVLRLAQPRPTRGPLRTKWLASLAHSGTPDVPLGAALGSRTVRCLCC